MSWSQAMRLCSIRSTIGSSPCPFLVRNVASSCSLTFPCLPIVWYVFFTAVLPSRFGNPILKNQAEPPLNFQLWMGHPHCQHNQERHKNQEIVGERPLLIKETQPTYGGREKIPDAEGVNQNRCGIGLLSDSPANGDYDRGDSR